ncbi:MAG TPA: pyridoxal-dependent decarboxylase [Propionibacteriaceae bacterium]|nr:pyridoxal-dependent decarboxylase [Propionibacteriaceae bacterium]
MPDPILDVDGALEPLDIVHGAAGGYLSSLADRKVRDGSALPRLEGLHGPLPTHGVGGRDAVAELVDVGTSAGTLSSGPRFFHFVIGGSTPAAMAADWLTSLLDQNAFSRASSDFASAVEDVALQWLCELVGLPGTWGGALVGSATFANFTGLACATHWWGEQNGVDVTSQGLAAVGWPMPVFSGGYVHPSARKALQMLGHGRDAVQVCAADAIGRVDLAALDGQLAELGGEPAVIIGNAGEVNAGDFDPIADLADIARRRGAWLHLDASFGLFAVLSPRSAHLVRGFERAHSIAADAHKWLNVPYESGFVLVAEPERLGRAFGMPGAPYLPGPDSPGAGYGLFGPESSRRARALPIWATLRAYGRDGYQAMVERHLDLAQRMAGLVDAAPDLERLAEAPLCIVCLRYRPHGTDDEGLLNALNRRLGEELLADGRVYAGTTVYGGRVALRPAMTNWRTSERDVDFFVDVVRELGARLMR